MITALLDESRAGIGPRLVLVAVRERLVVAAFPAHNVQGVAQFSGAQLLHPNVRLLVGDLGIGGVEDVQENQRDQKHRSAPRTYHHPDVSLVLDDRRAKWQKRRARCSFSLSAVSGSLDAPKSSAVFAFADRIVV